MATDHCSERTRLHRALRRQSRRLRVQYARGLSCDESSRSNSRHFHTFRQVKSLELIPIEGPGGRTELPIVDEPDLRIPGDTTPSGIGFCEVHICTFDLRLDMLAGDVERLSVLAKQQEVEKTLAEQPAVDASMDFAWDLSQSPWVGASMASMMDSWVAEVEMSTAQLQASLPCHVRFGQTLEIEADIANLQHVFGGLVVPHPGVPGDWQFEHDDLVSVTSLAPTEACASGKILSEVPRFRPHSSTMIGREGRVRRICGWNCNPQYVLVEFEYEKCMWLHAEHVKMMAKWMLPSFPVCKSACMYHGSRTMLARRGVLKRSSAELVTMLVPSPKCIMLSQAVNENCADAPQCRRHAGRA